MPRGIDPGFGHNVGKLGQIQPAQGLLAEKIAAAPPPLAAAAAKLEKLDDWVAAGRQERERLVEAAGGNPDTAGFSRRFQGALVAALRERRGAGTVKAEIGAGPQGGASAKRVAKAVEVLRPPGSRAATRSRWLPSSPESEAAIGSRTWAGPA